MIKEIYKFADIAVEAEYNFDSTQRFISGYEYDGPAQMKITVTDEDITNEKSIVGASDKYCEMLALYRLFCDRAIKYGVLLFHCSALEIDGKALLFTAPSGTGKSTHSALYRKLYGSRVKMINDDKPLIKKLDGVWRVYGTPWNGKHRLSDNSSAPIGGVCLLNRGEQNAIAKVSAFDAIPELYKQIYHNTAEEENVQEMLDLTADLAQSVPMWRMYCNMSDEAAQMSYNAMKEKTK